jgi:hypothetical protein
MRTVCGSRHLPINAEGTREGIAPDADSKPITRRQMDSEKELRIRRVKKIAYTYNLLGNKTGKRRTFMHVGSKKIRSILLKF